MCHSSSLLLYIIIKHTTWQHECAVPSPIRSCLTGSLCFCFSLRRASISISDRCSNKICIWFHLKRNHNFSFFLFFISFFTPFTRVTQAEFDGVGYSSIYFWCLCGDPSVFCGGAETSGTCVAIRACGIVRCFHGNFS